MNPSLPTSPPTESLLSTFSPLNPFPYDLAHCLPGAKRICLLSAPQSPRTTGWGSPPLWTASGGYLWERVWMTSGKAARLAKVWSLRALGTTFSLTFITEFSNLHPKRGRTSCPRKHPCFQSSHQRSRHERRSWRTPKPNQPRTPLLFSWIWKKIRQQRWHLVLGLWEGLHWGLENNSL